MRHLQRILSIVISVILLFPAGVLAAPAEAPEAHVKALQGAAKAGLLTKEEALFVKKGMTDVAVTEALAALYDDVVGIDAGKLEPGAKGYDLDMVKDLLAVVTEKKGALRDRKVSAWTLENRLQKIVKALSEKEREALKAEAGEPVQAPPEVTKKDMDRVRKSLVDVEKKLSSLEKDQAERLEEIEKTDAEDRKKVSGVQDDLSLIRDNLDALQENVKGLRDKVDGLSGQVVSKGMDAEEQERQWNLMRKDIRDHSQDLTVLKQKVENLMAPEHAPSTGLDRALSSKWLPGAAVILSIGAVILATSK